ncbi:MAG: sulfatase-like hydrolase/transferase [Candidatus Latescibacteria bacterium]|nr:sulfatase-like hydrolase/transferase [Candidatus Latescibacterota bacterium]MDP7448588.1 sulfatase-like hydrolase/transferase [Candidatus Latescibacterota bacterium]HJP32825.1 sulfatase-like hydrolase/transferase [Candidatus Latescibacterota bacterium]
MPARPNILFLLSDEHSHRFLSARSTADGGEPCRTPTLDGLIGQGAHFATAYCQMPLCTPSRIAMLCGRHAHRSGAWSNSSILPPELPTFASHLGAAGYATCTVGKMHLGGSRQYGGFQHRPYGDFGGPCGHQFDPLHSYQVDDSLPGMDMRSRTVDAGLSEVPESQLQENAVARESLAWLREHRHTHPEQPWLLMSSFSRPHFPLTAPPRHFDRYWPEGATEPRVGGGVGDSAEHPMTRGAISGFRTDEIEPEEGRKARAAYFACVDFLDELLGDYLALLEHDGLLDNTVIVYASDHGEMAGEHGLWWKNTWHEASARVPLIISTPEHRRGELPARQIDDPVSLADLFPTFCGFADIDPADDLDGVDLSTAARGETCPGLDERPGVYTEAPIPRWGDGTEFRMLRTRQHKYVAFRGCADLAFDITDDPLEQKNLLSSADTSDREATMNDLRELALDGFDFDTSEALRLRQITELRSRYPARVQPETPNQVLRGDGRLVEADAPLYDPTVVSSRTDADFDR